MRYWRKVLGGWYRFGQKKRVKGGFTGEKLTPKDKNSKSNKTLINPHCKHITRPVF